MVEPEVVPDLKELGQWLCVVVLGVCVLAEVDATTELVLPVTELPEDGVAA